MFLGSKELFERKILIDIWLKTVFFDSKKVVLRPKIGFDLSLYVIILNTCLGLS